jgi:hypothetical protein
MRTSAGRIRPLPALAIFLGLGLVLVFIPFFAVRILALINDRHLVIGVYTIQIPVGWIGAGSGNGSATLRKQPATVFSSKNQAIINFSTISELKGYRLSSAEWTSIYEEALRRTGNRLIGEKMLTARDRTIKCFEAIPMKGESYFSTCFDERSQLVAE